MKWVYSWEPNVTGIGLDLHWLASARSNVKAVPMMGVGVTCVCAARSRTMGGARSHCGALGPLREGLARVLRRRTLWGMVSVGREG